MGVLREIYFSLNHFGSRWHSLHFAFVALNIFLAGVVRYNIILFHHFPFLLFLSSLDVSLLGLPCHNNTMQLYLHFSRVPVVGDGMLRRIRSRGLRGPPQWFYLVIAFPLNRHLFQRILFFLTTDQFQFTIDVYQLSQCSTFMLTWTLTIRQVDTPSIASADESASD